jgi:glycogen operon protein
MSDEDWNASLARCMGVFLAGEMPGEVDKDGNPLIDSSLIILLNSSPDSIQFTLPESGAKWKVEVDTGATGDNPERRPTNSGGTVDVAGRSVLLLKQIG